MFLVLELTGKSVNSAVSLINYLLLRPSRGITCKYIVYTFKVHGLHFDIGKHYELIVETKIINIHLFLLVRT